MDRLPNWRSRLDECINDYETVEFKLGKHDCSTFVADAIIAQTGIDLFTEFRGKYRTMKGGYKLHRKLGYDSHIDIFANHLTPIHISEAGVGDIGVVQADNENEALCVILGRFAVGVTELGLIRFDLSLVTKVFKIWQ